MATAVSGSVSSTLPAGTSKSEASANGTANSSSVLPPPAQALLSELLESSRNLPNASSDVGSIQLGLSEIRKRAQKLREHYVDDNDTKAHYLLAGSGVNAEDIASELQSIVFHQNLETTTFTANEPDLDYYLRAKKEENILASIEESVRSAGREFDLYLAGNVTLDWETRKRQICSHFGLVAKSSGGAAGASGSVSGNSTRNLRQSSLRRSSGIGASSTTPKKAATNGSIAHSWGRATLGRLVLGPSGGNDADGEFTDVDFIQWRRTGNAADYAEGNVGEYDSETSSLANSSSVNSATKRYAHVVTQLNEARLDNRPFAIASAFSSVIQNSAADTKSQQMHDAWKILGYISGEQDSVSRRTTPITIRKYARAHIDSDKINSTDAVELRRRIVSGSRRYLEEQFYELIESEILKYPQDAQLGGVPSVYNKIKAYLNLKFLKGGKWTKSNLEIVNNIPIWALLYYMIRTGHLKDALEFTLQIEKSLRKIERSFPVYLKAFVADPDHRLPRDLQERLHTEFNQHIRFLDEDSDPYKYALYKIIGRCELSRKSFPEVLQTTEDWLWIHFMLTREGDGLSSMRNPSLERYSLLDLQRVVVQFGAKHFNPNKKTPGLYFQVLLLSGLFEWAVQYAYSFSQVDAVHFAIALTYYGLLNPVTDVEKYSSELLILDNKETPQLNFVRLIGYYTRDFRRSDPSEAVDYLILICLNGDITTGGRGKQHLRLAHEALKELVLETREFSRLLGDIRADGTRQPGAIEQKMALINISDPSEFLHSITEQAAIKASEYGRTADSILLYQLSEEYDTVVSIIIKSLGEFLSVVEIGRPMTSLPSGVPLMLSATDDPAQLARSMMQVYSANPAILSKVSQRNRETCNVLLQIVAARDLFAAGQWKDCLQEVDNTGILTLSPQADIAVVRRRAQQFVGLHESIARNVPSLLVMVMQCLVNESQALNDSAYSNSGRANNIAELRIRARNCMTYAGMIQYRMPREVYSQLTSLEILV
ncbi:linker nucleoporin NIC96 [Sugiyamaella lignohabitans]|uniref:Nuclear pore protein n=1 Tax=Sugiyamaella lignohabitans TaxID=796027 RepID=A0A167ENQ0_9ASCO|nr:linker nucleoporin NIC96 [Sugiyamaella lignohabitans]ANB14289.1 linker nucleoporin NIC96 [Sugiyamaella lignohabitans]